jgi:hypothetical protein
LEILAARLSLACGPFVVFKFVHHQSILSHGRAIPMPALHHWRFVI